MMAVDRFAAQRLWSSKPLKLAASQGLAWRDLQSSYSHAHNASCMLARTGSSGRSKLAYPLQVICNVC
jgi:hypothetical protein